jgi:polysaccharide deacetylase 2 family uncharacterized protein YibQ
MRKEKKYQIAIIFLCLVIFLQWMSMLSAKAPRRARGVKPKPAPIVAIKGKIAIVLDDWGYNSNNLQAATRIKYPITAAVLPNLSYSRRLCEALHRRGFEIILHLPLEPRQNFRLEKDTIMTSMDPAKVVEILDVDLSSLDYVRGVSNHMGSRATEDAGLMGIILGELKKRQLYFLDSFDTSNSVCAAVAKSTGVSFARRDVFLDNSSDPEYIKRQVFQLKTKARLNGRAVGIGHDRKATLEVLKEVMPQLEKEGYRFVYLSEITK